MSAVKQLMTSFDVVDKLYCFCKKNGLKFSISMVLTLGKSLELESSMSEKLVHCLQILWCICPELLGVVPSPMNINGDNTDYDIQYLSLKGIGKRHVCARRSHVLSKLKQICLSQYESFLLNDPALSVDICQCMLQKSSRSSGWDDFSVSFDGAFDLNQVKLPSPLPLNSLQRIANSSQLTDDTESQDRTARFKSTFSAIPKIFSCSHFERYLSSVITFPAREACHADLDKLLTTPLCCAVRHVLGIDQFYSHQADAINATRCGKHTVVCTGTASGKSMAYLIPVLDDLITTKTQTVSINASPATALFLFPTKALAHDQLSVLSKVSDFLSSRSLKQRCDKALKCNNCSKDKSKLIVSVEISCAVYDGDTALSDRDNIRNNSDIILTNPDLLHCTMLPQHHHWRRFLSSLKFIVLDEFHVYSGIFGVHVSCVLKRLIQLCNAYGTHPQFICTSATVARPMDHIIKLLPENFKMRPHITSSPTKDVSPKCLDTIVVSKKEDGSPCGTRYVCVWNPRHKRSLSWKSLDPDNINADNESTLERKDGVLVEGLKNARFTLNNQLESDDIALDDCHVCEDVEAMIQFVENSTDNSCSFGEPATPLVSWRCQRREPGECSKLSEVSDDEGSRKSSNIHKRKRQRSRNGVAIEVASEGIVADVEMHCSRDESNRDCLGAAVNLFIELLVSDLKTIVFCKSRAIVEMFTNLAMNLLQKQNSDLANRVSSYRGGYDCFDRRRLEGDFKSGVTVGMITTNAMELGIDIGQLDVTVHYGFPASVSSLWQQIGRCGRSNSSCLSILVCTAASTDEYFYRNPGAIVTTISEAPPVAFDVDGIIKLHLLCALTESSLLRCHPCIEDFTLVWGGRCLDCMRQLQEEGKLSVVKGNLNVRVPLVPFSIRSIEKRVVVYDSVNQSVLDYVLYSRSFFELYTGAVYLNQGRKFLVESLDLIGLKAYCTPAPRQLNFFTKIFCETLFRVERVIARKTLKMIKDNFNEELAFGRVSLSLGRIVVEKSSWRVRKYSSLNKAVLDEFNISLPILQNTSEALWLKIPQPHLEAWFGTVSEALAALHGISHALLIGALVETSCTESDINCFHSFSMSSPLVVCASSDNGNSAIYCAFEKFDSMFKHSLEILECCECTEGCPSCLFCFSCPIGNDCLSKKGAIHCFRKMLEKTPCLKL